ncbi:MAG: HAD family phosphatase [Chroococcidiopsidaceae cyanobacterium CP_BM_ER_R8_30]|nr:HAD family phosphatase [Chroococcidiopsidaceae cyanobacterium CP_BM_ER_R8_30]
MNTTDPKSTNQKVSLLVADVDGTLVTKQKVLTERARQAVVKLRDAGIAFAITSGRPPLGMKMFVDALELTAPLSAFNGGVFLNPDYSIIEQNLLPKTVAEHVVDIIKSHGLDVWIYSDKDWYVPERHGPHVDREEWTVKFPPKVVSSFDGLLDKVAKIVGVSDDYDLVARCEADVQKQFSQHVSSQTGDSSSGGAEVCAQPDDSTDSEPEVSAARSQPYYLDVTHPHANKGFVIDRLSELLNIPKPEIATIGDMPNDVPMFKRGGVSIAMGNSSEEVQHSAQYVTTDYENEGFANAVERFILGNQ